MNTRRLTTMAVLSALAVIIHVLEAQIPPVIPVQGVKWGLSNVITMYAVWALGGKDAIQILLVRILMGAIFADHFTVIFYSMAGGMLATLITIGLKHIVSENLIWTVGILAAVGHSLGQLAVAVFINGAVTALIFLPVLLICSLLTGLLTGLCSQIMIKRGKNLWKTIFK